MSSHHVYHPLHKCSLSWPYVVGARGVREPLTLYLDVDDQIKIACGAYVIKKMADAVMI